jgi:flagellar motor switch protein FliM
VAGSRDEAAAGLAMPSTPSTPSGRELPWYERRRSDLLGPVQLATVREVHQGVARGAARTLSNALRAQAKITAADAEQRLYRSFVTSIATIPCVAAPIALEPLPGAVVVILPADIALCVVDRLMGGEGRPIAPRGLTELELLVVADFLQLLLPPLAEAFEPLATIRPALTDIEINPGLIRSILPTDLTLLQYLAFTVPGTPFVPATLTLCYPVETLRTAFAAHDPATVPGPAATTPVQAVTAQLAQMGVQMGVHLRPSRVSAGDLLSLRVGDVLRLDHKTDEPALGAVRGIDLLSGSVGTRGGRLGFRVGAWRNNDE